MNRYFVFILILVFAQSCKDDPCFKGSGSEVEERRNLPDNISTISLYDKLNLNIHIDSSNYLIVKGGKNIIDFIKSEVSGNELKLSNENSCAFLRGFDDELIIDLHVKSFNTLLYEGSGNITMKDTLNIENFKFSTESGAGSLRLLLNVSNYFEFITVDGFTDTHVFGKGKLLNLYNDGTGWFFAKEFQCEESTIETRGTGDCIINVSDKITCKLNGIGNIQYKGNPSIEVIEKKGNGRLIPVK